MRPYGQRQRAELCARKTKALRAVRSLRGQFAVFRVDLPILGPTAAFTGHSVPPVPSRSTAGRHHAGCALSPR